MRLLATTLLAIGAIATTTVSAQDQAYPRGRVIGSIEIPALHDAVNRDLHGQPAALSLVTLYIEPTEHTAVAAVVSDRTELTSLEHGYEQLSAAVYEMREIEDRVWYRVHYTTSRSFGDGWISNRDTSTFHPLADMLVHGLAFLTDSWDRAVFDAPRPNSNKRTIPVTMERPNVHVVATAGDAAHLWLQVELLDGSACEGSEQPAVAIRGWIPAFSANGQLSAWHYARGSPAPYCESLPALRTENPQHPLRSRSTVDEAVIEAESGRLRPRGFRRSLRTLGGDTSRRAAA